MKLGPSLAWLCLLVATSPVVLPHLSQTRWDEHWVQDRVAEWKIQPAEHRYDDIAWVSSLSEGLRRAKQEQRPIFLFCANGDLCSGRL